VIAGLRGEDSVSELCRKEGINQNLYYRSSKDFLEAGKKRLAGDTAREATSDEVKGLRAETHQLKELLAELNGGEPSAEKKRARGWGVRYMRYAAAEKLEIIRLVEQSSLSGAARHANEAAGAGYFAAPGGESAETGLGGGAR
jgi:transposase-like protein